MSTTRECPTCRGTGTIPDAALPVGFTAMRLTALMAEREMTQTQLGQVVGKTQTGVSYWLAGKRRPNYDDLCTLADLFGVTTDYLLGRTAERLKQEAP